MSLALLLLLLAAVCRSRLVNVTIDDQHGDAVTGVKPVYSPGRNWHAVSESSAGLLDMAQVHDRTLQSFQRNGSITLAFEGVAIYVFFVLPQPATSLNVTSFLDDMSRPVGQYNPSPGSAMGGGPANRFAYNQLVFSSGPLPQRTHSLTVSVQSYLTYFDYAVYTVDDGAAAEPSPSRPVPTNDAPARTPIGHSGKPDHTPASQNLGALVGGVVAAAIMCVLLLCIWRRTTRRCARAHGNQRAPAYSADNEAGEPRDVSLQDDIDLDTLVIRDAVSPFFASAESTRARADSKQDAWQTASEKAATGTVTHELRQTESMLSLRVVHPSSEAALSSTASSGQTWSTISHSGAAAAAGSYGNAADVRAEMDRMRAEIDMLRRVARVVGPPPYSDGGWSERSAHASL